MTALAALLAAALGGAVLRPVLVLVSAAVAGAVHMLL